MKNCHTSRIKKVTTALIALLMGIILSAPLSGCLFLLPDFDTPQEEESDIDWSDSYDDDDYDGYSDAELSDDLEIVAEYSCPEEYWDYDSYVVVVKNNSSEDVSLTVKGTALDEDGSMVEVSSNSDSCLQSGTEGAYKMFFDEAYEEIEVKLSAYESYYQGINTDLAVEANNTSDKVIVKVTNEGSKTAEYVQATVLFFSGEDLVGAEYNYIGNTNSEIKPGDSETEEISLYSDATFDSYEVYLQGYAE